MAPGARKGILRKKKVAAKRWSKGQSSSCNPQTTKYRERAKGQWLCPDLASQGKGVLTQTAVDLHNAAEQETDDVCRPDDDQVSIGKTSLAASVWTTTSQVSSFNRFLKGFRYDCAMHKNMLAIISGIGEVIKDAGRVETETEFFLSLATSLDSLDSMDDLLATVSLMSMIIPRVSTNILKLKFGEFSKMLDSLLEQHGASESNDQTLLVRQLMVCIAHLLHVQDKMEWRNSKTKDIFNKLLSLTVSAKPKVRKTAQQAVCIVHRGSSFADVGTASGVHEAAIPTADFCIRELKAYDGVKKQRVLYVLNLLKAVLGFFPVERVKGSCDEIFSLMVQGNAKFTSCALSTLQNLFDHGFQTENIPPSLTTRIVNALFNCCPVPDDADLLVKRIGVMQAAFLHLQRCKVEGDEIYTLLELLFKEASKAWLFDSSKVQRAVTHMLKALVFGWVESLNDSLSPAKEKNVKTLFAVTETCLSLQYHYVWDQVLHVLAVFFEVAGKLIDDKHLKECLQKMAGLREDHLFSFVNELDYALGMAVRHVGPQKILDAIPLANEHDICVKHNWLIPILRDNIRNPELGFFASHFLPLAVESQRRAKLAADDGRVAESANLTLFNRHIWSLLPAFCSNATDLSENFKTVAPTLGKGLNEHPELRIDILMALRQLVNQNLEHETNRMLLQRFSKNYLPIFFNLYTCDAEDKAHNYVRMAILETIAVYLQITSKEICYKLFDRATVKLQDEASTPYLRQSILDINRTMIPYLDEERLERMFQACSSLFQSEDKTINKKALRSLQEICKGGTDACQSIITNHLDQLKNMFSTLETGSPSVKAIKLNSLACLLKFFKNREKVLTALLAKTILCTKEPSLKARTAALGFLEEMLMFFVTSKGLSKAEGLQTSLDLILAGLAGSPNMVSATISCIGYLVQKYKETIEQELLEQIMGKINLLFASESKLVVQGVLDFFTLTISLRPDVLEAQLGSVIQNLFCVSREMRVLLKCRVRDFLTKLVRKFGFKRISEIVPTHHHPMIVNMNKTIQRKKRQQKSRTKRTDKGAANPNAKQNSLDALLGESDEEEDDDTPKTSRAWIHEKTQESIVDFLDPTSSKNIRGTPSSAMQYDEKKVFETSKDGRLIIEEPERRTRATSAAESAGAGSVSMLLLNPKENLSKRKRDDDDEDDEEEEEMGRKYQAGGLGIHRPVASKSGVATGGEYRAKKAGGDIKREGQPNPYAYIPMDRSILNRRKQGKEGGRYKKLLQSARAGARKGRQQRTSRKKK